MALSDVHVLNPGTCEDVSLHDKGALQMQLKILRRLSWIIFFWGAGGWNVITRILLLQGKQEDQSERER